VLRPRVIPALTMEHLAMVKTQRFAKPTYLGDPINAVRVLNSKEVDELIILDITASAQGRTPDPTELAELASECFMPVCYGGGVRSVEDADAVLRCGFEKVAVNTAALERPALVRELADRFGSQAVVAGIDVDQSRRGRRVRAASRRGARDVGPPAAWAQHLVEQGAGEVLLTATYRDGTGEGYDLDLVAEVATAVEVPVLALGGAGSLDHIQQALGAGAAGAVAGRFFLTRGPHLAALVSYPTPEAIEGLTVAVHADG
jgi:imidazole glycerol-phosphate synthase subunit HisF